VFTPVKHGRTLKNKNTQFNVINCLTKDMLNNLLVRFENQSIINDIITERNNRKYDNIFSIIESKVSIHSKKQGPSLYINYFDKNQNQVFHATFHLCPTFYGSKSNSFIHFTQNMSNSKSNKTIISNICRHPDASDSIYFCLGKVKGYDTIDTIYKQEAEVINHILNTYFHIKDKNKYLGYGKSKPHRYLEDFYQKMSNSRKLTRRKNKKQKLGDGTITNKKTQKRTAVLASQVLSRPNA
jgi:hypothetical protein